MAMLDKIPSLTDDELATLLVNAERLEQTGTTAQRSAAAELVPAIRQELSTRKPVKRTAAPKKPRASRKRVRKEDAESEAASEPEPL